MGNTNSMIDINFDRIQPTIYYAGDTISGQVHFTVQERTGNIEDIYLIVTGDVGYTTMRTTRIQSGQMQRVTDHHDIRILREKVVLGQVISSEQKQASGRIHDTTTLEPGQYSYSFSIRLPDILPPTIHPKDYPFIRYELQLIIEKKWYCANTHHRYPLRIYPRVNLLQISHSQCAVKFDTKRKDITIKGTLQRSGLIPGEETTLSLEIFNPNHLAIKRLEVCLIQRYVIEQCRRRLELLRLPVPQLFDTNDEHVETTCSIKIPVGIPPSYNYTRKGGSWSVRVNIHYDIKIEVKAKGLFSDFDLQVPIIIGTDSAEYSSYAGISTASTIPMDLNAIDILELEGADDDGIPSAL